MTGEAVATGSPPAVSDLGGSVGRGVSWSALNAVLLRSGQLLMGIVTARIIAPREFGVFAVALTAFAIVANVSDLGVGSAILREVDRTRAIAPTVYTLGIGTSVVLGGAMALSAPYVATQFGASAAADAIRVLSLTVVIGAGGTVPAALITRDYLQKRRFASDAVWFVVANVTLIPLALNGSGVMALAWSRVVAQFASTVVLITLTPERYRPGFDRREVRGLLRFGLPLAGANLVAFSIANLDFIVVGRLLGALRLGYYNLAYNVSSWPVSVFTAVLNNVTLTTLSRVRHSVTELEDHLSAALSTLAAAAFPVSAMLMVLSDPLVRFLYGERWSPSAPALAALAAFGSLRVVIALLSDVLVALGRTRRLMLLQVIWISALLPALILGAHLRGIVGVGLAQVSVGAAVVLPAYLLAVSRGTGLGLGWLGKSVRAPLLATIVSGAAAWPVERHVHQPFLACVTAGAVGAVVYAAVLWPWARRHITMLRRMYGSSGSRVDDSGPAPTRSVPTAEPS